MTPDGGQRGEGGTISPMCGRYDLIDSPQMLALYFMLDMIAEPYSNADVRPTNMAPIIRVRDGQRLSSRTSSNTYWLRKLPIS